MELIANHSERAELGRRAAETLRAQMGATQRTMQALEKLLAPATPHSADLLRERS
jgi:hypothetical protein